MKLVVNSIGRMARHIISCYRWRERYKALLVRKISAQEKDRVIRKLYILETEIDKFTS